MAGLEGLAVLAAGTSSFDAVAGGERSTSKEDKLAILAGCSSFTSDFVVLKVTMSLSLGEVLACSNVDGSDRSMRPVGTGLCSVISELNAKMFFLAKGVCDKRGLSYGRGYNLMRVSELALAEMLVSARCKRCKGCGSVRSDAVVKGCGRCDGSGLLRMSNYERGNVLGMCESSFRRNWSARHALFMQICSDAEAEFLGKVRREGRGA